MTEIIPFRGIYYNRDKVTGEEVTAPPYDVITPRMREELYARSPYNVVRIDFGKELDGDGDSENKYSRAAALLKEWQGIGVLKRSEKPTFYAYRMDYALRGKRMSLTGFFGLARLVELGEGVYPHEATHSKPKQDRLSLMNFSAANTSPVYSLYRAPGPGVAHILKEAASKSPYLQAIDHEGAVHSMWLLEDEGMVEGIRDGIRGASVFIADGHHRYETALAYRDAMREKSGLTGGNEPFDYVLMFLAPINDEGLAVLPTHRVVTTDIEEIEKRLSDHFEVEGLAPDADILSAMEGREHAFGLYAGGRRYVLSRENSGGLEDVDPAIRGLDVVVLHKMILGKLLDVGNWAYEMDYSTTLARVDKGEYDAAFFLNPTTVREVEQVALRSLRMPPKSTYFYPKVQTGFVMNSLKSF